LESFRFCFSCWWHH